MIFHNHYAPCPGNCQPDCTCPVACQTAYCYIEFPEDLFNPPDASCVEYPGTAAQIASFLNCCLGGAWNAVFIHTPVMAPCIAGEVTGVPCTPAGPNHVLVPKDSSCP